MEVVIISAIEQSETVNLVERITEVAQIGRVSMTCFENLFPFLRSKISGEMVIVFIIASKDELNFLLRNKSRFFNTKFIILLSDDQDDWVSKALAMQPRYLGFLAEGHTMVGRVLARMVC